MPVTVALVGTGVVGSRIAKRLAFHDSSLRVTSVDSRVASVESSPADVVVLAQGGPHAELARQALLSGRSVVSVSGDPGEIREMCDLDDIARDAGASLVVGAARSPGLTDLLARHLVAQLATCEELHLAVHGTAGPACAHEHHRALSGQSVALHDGRWVAHRSGSGRELCWFPEPVGAYDCYRADLASPFLIGPLFPDVGRITVRQSANRRDRLTARLPMLTPPHAEGGVGAVRVEARGSDASGGRLTLVVGTAELVGTTAAATASAFVVAVLGGDVPSGAVTAGDPRLDTTALLHDVERFGVRLQEFTGIPTSA